VADQIFVWCFDHASVHEGTWCTATCVPLAGGSRKQAMDDKVARFGDAFGLYDLPALKREAVVAESQRWRAGGRVEYQANGQEG
jgi:hypothetical protein